MNEAVNPANTNHEHYMNLRKMAYEGTESIQKSTVTLPSYEQRMKDVLEKVTLFEEADRPQKGKFRATIEPSIALTPYCSVGVSSIDQPQKKFITHNVVFKRKLPKELSLKHNSPELSPGQVSPLQTVPNAYITNLKGSDTTIRFPQEDSSFGFGTLTSSQLRDSLFENSTKKKNMLQNAKISLNDIQEKGGNSLLRMPGASISTKPQGLNMKFHAKIASKRDPNKTQKYEKMILDHKIGIGKREFQEFKTN